MASPIAWVRKGCFVRRNRWGLVLLIEHIHGSIEVGAAGPVAEQLEKLAQMIRDAGSGHEVLDGPPDELLDLIDRH